MCGKGPYHIYRSVISHIIASITGIQLASNPYRDRHDGQLFPMHGHRRDPTLELLHGEREIDCMVSMVREREGVC